MINLKKYDYFIELPNLSMHNICRNIKSGNVKVKIKAVTWNEELDLPTKTNCVSNIANKHH